jgi:AbrB family looped-hinge helix DNA binding protein
MVKKLVKVLRNGDITIPKNYREKYGIETDDYFTIEYDGNKIILTPKK